MDNKMENLMNNLNLCKESDVPSRNEKHKIWITHEDSPDNAKPKNISELKDKPIKKKKNPTLAKRRH